MFGIYCIEHIKSGRRYVGKSKHIGQRIKEHIKTSRSAPKSGRESHFSSALRKFGWDEFKWWVVEETNRDPKVLAERELFWIDEFGTFVAGFNTKRESAGVTEFSQRVKDKISQTLKGRPLPQQMIDRLMTPKTGAENPFYGKRHSAQAKQKMSAASKRRWNDCGYREKMERRPVGAGMAGKTTPASTRAKQSAAKAGKPPPNMGVKYTGDALYRMRVGATKRSVNASAKRFIGVDSVDISL